jgi:NAD(P)-dependent dehydrogenase (short-subunit alcohol dehydrogenase family)
MSSPFLPDVLKGKVVFVTGGATGIGFSICETLGKHGANIAIMGRRVEVLEKAVSELQSKGTLKEDLNEAFFWKKEAIRTGKGGRRGAE